jgi:hypothetical protein
MMPTKKQNKNLMSSGRREKRNIVKKKRTSSCVTGLQNLGASARTSLLPQCADWNDSGDGKIAGDRVKESNRGKHDGRDGENGVHNSDTNDVCIDRKNEKEDEDWAFGIDSDSDVDNEGR